jgi:hypothetical protein
MSDTPRTDEAELHHVADNYSYNVTADFARTLERELAAATEEIQNIKSALGEHPDSHLDVPLRIKAIRDEGRSHFHAYTKTMFELESLKREKPLSDLYAKEASD